MPILDDCWKEAPEITPPADEPPRFGKDEILAILGYEEVEATLTDGHGETFTGTILVKTE